MCFLASRCDCSYWPGSHRCLLHRSHVPELFLMQHTLPLVSTLILLRHGQSVWNGPDARFTGWCDVPLTVKGRVEAVSVGQLRLVAFSCCRR